MDCPLFDSSGLAEIPPLNAKVRKTLVLNEQIERLPNSYGAHNSKNNLTYLTNEVVN